MAALPRPEPIPSPLEAPAGGRGSAALRALASEEGLRELAPEESGETAGSRRALRALPADLAALRDRLSRGRDLIPVELPPEDLFPTAIPALDAVLAGGLARGLLTELRGAPSSGRLSLVLSLLATATGRGEAAALIDLGDHLDPQAAVAAGVDLGRLLWVRPTRLREALAAAEIALAGAFPLVVLELGGAPVRAAGGRNGARRGSDEHAWLRLARAARHHRGALLVSTPYRITGTAAAEVLVLSRRRGVWLGSGAAPRLLLGVDSRLQREKSRRQPFSATNSSTQPATAGVVWRAAEAVQTELPWGPRAAPAAPPVREERAPAAPPADPPRRRAVTAPPRAVPARPPRAPRPSSPTAPSDRAAGSAGGPRLSAVAAAVAGRVGRHPRPVAARPRRVPGWVPLARAALAESLRDAPPRGRA